MPNKDEYLQDTLKYSIWNTNTDSVQSEHDLELRTGLNEKSKNQLGQVKQAEDIDE